VIVLFKNIYIELMPVWLVVIADIIEDARSISRVGDCYTNESFYDSGTYPVFAKGVILYFYRPFKLEGRRGASCVILSLSLMSASLVTF
jgi:hypothetical protein